MRYISLAVATLAASGLSPSLSAPTRYSGALDVFHARASPEYRRSTNTEHRGRTRTRTKKPKAPRKGRQTSEEYTGPRVHRPPANLGSTSATALAPGRPPRRSDSVSSDASTIIPPTPKASKSAPLEPEYAPAPKRRDRVDKGEAGEELSTSGNFALRAFGGLGASGNLAGVPKDVPDRQEVIPADATLTSTVGKRHVAQGDKIMAHLISRMLNELD